MATVDPSLSVEARGQALPSGAAPAEPAAAPPRRLCAFWLRRQLFALDVALVGEVIEVAYLAPVPRSHPAVIGLFNLRGEPVALLDLPRLIGLPSSPAADQPGPWPVVVLRAEGQVAGFQVDRLEAVVSIPEASLVQAPTGDTAHLLLGFAELEGEPRRTLSVLAPAVLLERLRAIAHAGSAA